MLEIAKKNHSYFFCCKRNFSLTSARVRQIFILRPFSHFWVCQPYQDIMISRNSDYAVLASYLLIEGPTASLSCVYLCHLHVRFPHWIALGKYLVCFGQPRWVLKNAHKCRKRKWNCSVFARDISWVAKCCLCTCLLIKVMILVILVLSNQRNYF